MKKRIFTLLFICPLVAIADDVNTNTSNNETTSIVVVPKPFSPLALPDNLNIDSNIEKNISEDALKYVDSYVFSENKKEIEDKINNQDAQCLDETSKIACLNGRGERLYEEYKIKNFLDGIYYGAKKQNVKINDNSLFAFLENDMNQHKDKNNNGQPDLLSIIDDKNVESNLLLKLISYKCSMDNKDSTSYVSCVVNFSKDNENVFLRMKAKCLDSTTKNKNAKTNFNLYLQSCINNEMIQDDMIKWISFQSYRLGDIYFNVNKESFSKGFEK